ncbi:hypothetical protein B0H14DRAFT_2571630 [Mycena olivaceomarginata]|nr:hypothetical protein B0H14DRAFT_2571630 [Mycena olivaceomarginata]
MLIRLFFSAVGAVVGVQLIRAIFKFLSWRLYSPFRYMPGPPNPSWIYGNFGSVTFPRTQEWQAQYRPTFRFDGLFSVPTLYTIDTVALHHIVNTSDIYQKAPMVRFNMMQNLGRGESHARDLGLLATEDDEHTKLSPAFGPSQVRGLTQLFVDKALEGAALRLSEVWANQVKEESGWASIEVLSGLKAMTLDVIGLAGFNYQFHALNADRKPTELDGALKNYFSTAARSH